MGGIFGGKSDPPPAPDYSGAAQAQGQANLAAARASAKLSNPSFDNPYGSRRVTYGFNGDPDAAYVQDTLSPAGQQVFDSQMGINQNMADAASAASSKISENYAKPFSFSGVDDLVGKAQDAIMSRLNPILDRQRDMRETALITGGHARGSEGYGAEMGTLDRSQNDARMQGILAALGYAPALLQQQLTLRNQPLNELNALRTGAQVQLPQFQNISGVSAAPAPVFAATQAQDAANMSRYNAGVAESNAMLGGLTSLGAAFLGAPAGGMASKIFGFGR